ncbi:circularly permuted type 2 ATP-grasp protein, partial [Nocardioides albidus]
MREPIDPAALAARTDGHERNELTEQVNRVLEERGVRFGPGEGHPFRVDPLPRLLDREEWVVLADGVRQRVRALDAFVSDVYGERRCVADGIVPRAVLDSVPYLEPDLQGCAPHGGPWVGVAGLDVVRDGEGRLLFLEDNVRTPSGIDYAMAVSDAVAQVLGVEARTTLEDDVPAALRGCLEASLPGADGVLALLTDGPANSAWYEHQRLAEEAGLTLVTPGDLRRRGDRLELTDGRSVRAVYRRTGEDRLRAEGRPTQLAELLLEPWRAGRLGLVNCFGTGVADDKSVYRYVEDLVR